jgi:hypothetical protein
MLQSILGQPQQRQQFDDFSQRYQQGAPWDGISDDEAYQHYSQFSGRVPPDVYEESARDAFDRLDPNQRAEFGRYLQARARDQGINDPDLMDLDGDGYADSSRLARATSRLDQQQPGMLGQLLGGGGGGGLGGMLGGGGGGGGLGGMLGGGGGGLGGMLGGGGGGGGLGGPIGKAVLGGIAAMAAQKMMSRR